MYLFSTSTKQKLIDLISDELCDRFTNDASSQRLVITSKSSVPEEIHCGVRIKRQDLIWYYDEADYMTPQQLSSMNDEKKQVVIKDLSDDAVVFVLFCSLFTKINWSSAKLYMNAFTDDNKLISINKSVATNDNVIPSVIALKALSGCDSVPMMSGIGKSRALKTVNKIPLWYIGSVDTNLEDVMREGKQFVARCYGQNHLSSSENRCVIWKNKTDGAKKSAKPPALRSLPLTDEALEMNIKRSHYVAIMWGNCVTGNPYQLSPCEYGWERNEGEESLRPTMLPAGTKVAPDKILQTARCKCASTQCKTSKCSRVRAGLKCSEFCYC